MLTHINKSGADGRWCFDADSTVGLPGAHGDEVVRSFCFYESERLVMTAGEDGCIRAWREG